MHRVGGEFVPIVVCVTVPWLSFEFQITRRNSRGNRVTLQRGMCCVRGISGINTVMGLHRHTIVGRLRGWYRKNEGKI